MDAEFFVNATSTLFTFLVLFICIQRNVPLALDARLPYTYLVIDAIRILD